MVFVMDSERLKNPDVLCRKNTLGHIGQTAAEIIKNRADSEKPYVGLTNWRGEKSRKQDVFIAKNYLE